MPRADEILNRAREYQPELTSWRRDLHAHPELGFEENRTSDFVAGKLSEFGIEVHRGLGGTGVVGTLRQGNAQASVALRADMDALPMQEENAFSHRSKTDGVMHACGHDGHTTMLLGAAQILAETRNFDGAVHFVFQPAEEGGRGARAMMEQGLFDRFPADRVFGLHNRPGLKVGKYNLREGAMMASSNQFDVHITGVGTHAARPESGADPVLAAAHIVVALQSIISRNVSPSAPAVLSVSGIQTGTTHNVIPQTAHLFGTVRTFSDEMTDLIEENINRVSKHVAEGLGTSATVKFRRGTIPLVNSTAETEVAANICAQLSGRKNVDTECPLIMGGEDFSLMLDKIPGTYINIGNGEDSKGVHHPGYDFNDAAIPFGVAYLVCMAEKYLDRN